MKQIKFLSFFTFLSLFCSAQLPGSNMQQSSVMDGFYIQEHLPTKRVVPYIHMRQADVMWAKRVWRVLDVREKMNHKLFYPIEPTSDRISLFDVLKQAVLVEKELTIYDEGVTQDDKFRFPVKSKTGNVSDPDFVKQLNGFFNTYKTEDSLDLNDDPVYDPATNKPYPVEVPTPYTSADIIRYEIKEDWFFDKQRSVMDVRIIGIAPVVYAKNKLNGEIEGIKRLFWVYFPDCRYIFQRYSVFNPQNDAQKMSFNDLFMKREFSSYISKESNMFDRKISPSWTGLNALLESERIKQEMFEKEHDLWHY